MKLFALWTATIILAFSTLAQASVKNFTVGDDQFTINVPNGWQTPKDFYGFPVSLIGPDNKEGHRTVIGIIPSGAADTEKVFDQGDKDIKSYISGREAWLEKFEGKSISYDSYQKTKWPGVEEAHTLGYHYELPTGKFYERSIFVLCNGRRLYHLKSITHSEYEKTDNKIVDETIKTLKCEKTVASATKPATK